MQYALINILNVIGIIKCKHVSCLIQWLASNYGNKCGYLIFLNPILSTISNPLAV